MASRLLLLLPSVSCYRRYLAALPPAHVPCPPGAAGCVGTPICEAFGHVDCWTGSPLGDGVDGGDDPSGTSTGFGTAGAAGWSLSLCGADSDGDGLTNGDELGDPCCNWPLLPLATTAAPSNPSFSTSTSSRKSCSTSTTKLAPKNLTWSQGGAGALAISVIPPTFSDACVCEWGANVTNMGTGVTEKTYRLRADPKGDTLVLNVCGLTAGATYSVQVWGANRGGPSLPPDASGTLTALTVSASGGVPVGRCTQVRSSSALVATDLVGTPAGAAAMAALLKAPAPATLGLAWFVAALALVLLPAFFAAHCAPEGGWFRRVTTHAYVPPWCIFLGRGAKPFSLPALAAAATSDLRAAGVGHSAMVGALVLGVALCSLQTSAYYAWLPFPLGTAFSGARGVGYAAAAVMGLQLLPITRFSLWTLLLHVPFERALILHRWAGWVTLIITWVHGIWLVYGAFLRARPVAQRSARPKHPPLPPYTAPHLDTQPGYAVAGENAPWWWPLRWSGRDAVNPLAGLLSGLLMLVLAVASLDCARRARYELFLAAHFTWPAIYGLAWVHIRHSDTPAAPLFALGILLLALDSLLLGLDGLLLRDTLVVDAGLCFAGGGVLLASSVKRGGGRCVGPCAPASGGACGNCGVASPEDALKALSPRSSAPIAAVLYFDKLPALGVSSWWPFSHLPGQYVYLAFPEVSMFPHPLSICSVEDRFGAPGRFAVTIKGLRGDSWGESWTGRVVTLVSSTLKKVAEAERARGGGFIVDAPTQLRVNVTSRVASARGCGAFAGGPGGASAHAWPAPVGGALLPPPFMDSSEPSPLHGLIRAWATGPFGVASLHLPSFSHFVLFAGGVGATPLVTLHQALVRGLPVEHAPLCGGCRLRGKPLSGAPMAVACVANLQSLTTVWSVREGALVRLFAPLLCAAPNAPLEADSLPWAERVTVRVFGGSGEGGRGEKPPLPLESGRPDVPAILSAAGLRAAKIDAARGFVGRTSVAVLVCGPDEMVKDVLSTAQTLTQKAALEVGSAKGAAGGVQFFVHRETCACLHPLPPLSFPFFLPSHYN